MMRKTVISAAIALLLMSAWAHAPLAADDKLDGLDAFIELAMKEYGVPGAAVAVVKDGDVVYLKGFGVRSVDRKEKIDGDTVFQLASVTKTFTAASVASMVDRGKIGFDEEVIKIIPDFALMDPYSTRYTTPRDLLAHRTGLPPLTGDLFDHLGYSRSEVIKRVRYFTPACSFRERANYSNIGYFLAGQAAAYAADTSWEDVVRENIIKPLGLKHTGFTYEMDKESDIAYPHGLVDGKTKVIQFNEQRVLAPAGAMTSSVSDLARYVIMLLGNGKFRGKEILKADSVEQLLTPAMVDKPSFAELPPISDETGFSYGLGWGIYHWQNHKILEKGGALDGYRSVVVLVPNTKLGIVVLANMNLTVLPEAVSAFVLEQYLGDADYDIQEVIMDRSKKIAEMLGMNKTAMPTNPNPPSKDLGAYTGTYVNDLYGRFSVLRDGDNLKVEAGPAKYTGKLAHVNYDTFYLSWPIFISASDEVTFVIDAKGNVTEFIDDSLGRFKKVD
ncbi:MAG: serine hydrolase [Thermodesulfobacteriota bacterium]